MCRVQKHVSPDLKLVSQLCQIVTSLSITFGKIVKKSRFGLVRVLRKGVRSYPLDMF